MRILIAAVLIAFATAATAAEPCRTQGLAEAKPVSLAPGDAADLLVSIPTVSKLHGLSSATLTALPAACDRGGFEAGGRRYVLTGENTDPHVPRRATAKEKSAPILYLADAFDLAEALGVPAEPGGEPKAKPGETVYVLASALNDVAVVWRAYDAIPDDTRLKADMAAALAPGAAPVMRFDMKGGRVQLMTP